MPAFSAIRRMVHTFVGSPSERVRLSSADWMSRNMTRRIELSWPVTDPVLKRRIVDECLLAYLHDTRNAWTLGPDGKYHRVEKLGRKVQSAQALLMARYVDSSNPVR